MSTRPVQSFGDTITIVAGGSYTADTPLKIGTKLFGIPQATVSSGSKVALIIRGNVSLPKSGSGVVNFALGAPVYWNAGTSLCTATATDDFIGLCTATAANSSTTVDVELNGGIIDAVDADAIVAAGAFLASNVDTDSSFAANSDTKVASQKALKTAIDLKAAAADLAKIKSGTVSIASGANNGTAAMGAATWNSKPVVVTLQSAAGPVAAALIQYKAVVAANTLTVTLIDKDGAGVNAGSDLVFSYVTDAR